MPEPHFFEVIGTVLMRPSGWRSRITECVIVRTLARRHYGPYSSSLQFVELTSGSDRYQAADWFEDWDEERDNHVMTEDGDFGRPVDVAIPREDYELLSQEFHVPVGIVAVKVDGRWRPVTRLSELKDPTSAHNP